MAQLSRCILCAQARWEQTPPTKKNRDQSSHNASSTEKSALLHLVPNEKIKKVGSKIVPENVHHMCPIRIVSTFSDESTASTSVCVKPQRFHVERKDQQWCCASKIFLKPTTALRNQKNISVVSHVTIYHVLEKREASAEDTRGRPTAPNKKRIAE